MLLLLPLKENIATLSPQKNINIGQCCKALDYDIVFKMTSFYNIDACQLWRG